MFRGAGEHGGVVSLPEQSFRGGVLVRKVMGEDRWRRVRKNGPCRGHCSEVSRVECRNI